MLPKAALEATLEAAVSYYSDGKFDDAEDLLLAVIDAQPQDARAFKLLGSIKMLTDKRRDAQRYFEQALALEPDDPYVLVALGELKIDVQRIQEGVDLIKRLLDAHQQHPAANRGRQLLKHTYERLKSIK